MIRMDKDYKLIKKMFFDYYLKNKKLLSIEEFDKIKPKKLKELRYYFNMYHIGYNSLVCDYLGFIKINNRINSKCRIYNKIILSDNFRKVVANKKNNNEPILSKNIKRDFGITLLELREIFNMNFVEFVESLGEEHYLSNFRKANSFDWSIAFENSY